MGFSLGEIFLLILVGIIVVGPKRLPALMRTAGQYVARIRRMSTDLRSQSGIDDLLRQEGLDQHIHELRSLSRLNVVDTLMAPAAARVTMGDPQRVPQTPPGVSEARLAQPSKLRPWKVDEPLREREYPLAGCDAHGALPDDATMYLPSPAPPSTDAPLTAATEQLEHEGEHPQPAGGLP